MSDMGPLATSGNVRFCALSNDERTSGAPKLRRSVPCLTPISTRPAGDVHHFISLRQLLGSGLRFEYFPRRFEALLGIVDGLCITERRAPGTATVTCHCQI